MARFMIQCIVLFSRQTAEEVKPENGLEALVNEKHYIVKVVKLNPWLTWNLMALLWPEIERFCLFEVVTLKWEEWEAQSAHALCRHCKQTNMITVIGYLVCGTFILGRAQRRQHGHNRRRSWSDDVPEGRTPDTVRLETWKKQTRGTWRFHYFRSASSSK